MACGTTDGAKAVSHVTEVTERLAVIALTVLSGACGEPTDSVTMDAAPPQMADSGMDDVGLDGAPSADAGVDAGPTRTDGSLGPSRPVGQHSDLSFMPFQCTPHWEPSPNDPYALCIKESCCELYNRCGSTHEDLLGGDPCLVSFRCMVECLHGSLVNDWPSAPRAAIEECAAECPWNSQELEDWRAAAPLVAELFSCALEAPWLERVDAGWQLIDDDSDAGAPFDPRYGCLNHSEYALEHALGLDTPDEAAEDAGAEDAGAE